MAIIVLKFGKPAPFDDGEQVLHTQRHFRAISSTSRPSYRIGFSIPILCEIALYVTDRRCRVVARMFWFLTQDIGMWYPGCNPEGDSEVITKVSCQNGIFGRCLEIRDHNPTRRQRWLWSPDITLRFFFRNPDSLLHLFPASVIHD